MSKNKDKRKKQIPHKDKKKNKERWEYAKYKDNDRLSGGWFLNTHPHPPSPPGSIVTQALVYSVSKGIPDGGRKFLNKEGKIVNKFVGFRNRGNALDAHKAWLQNQKENKRYENREKVEGLRYGWSIYRYSSPPSTPWDVVTPQVVTYTIEKEGESGGRVYINKDGDLSVSFSGLSFSGFRNKGDALKAYNIWKKKNNKIEKPPEKKKNNKIEEPPEGGGGDIGRDVKVGENVKEVSVGDVEEEVGSPEGKPIKVKAGSERARAMKERRRMEKYAKYGVITLGVTGVAYSILTKGE